jgi:hypothetical protein
MFTVPYLKPVHMLPLPVTLSWREANCPLATVRCHTAFGLDNVSVEQTITAQAVIITLHFIAITSRHFYEET